MTPALLALLGALGGGALLQLLTWLLKRRKVDTLPQTLRQELQGELSELRAGIAAVEAEIDDWKDKYYHLLEIWASRPR